MTSGRIYHLLGVFCYIYFILFYFRILYLYKRDKREYILFLFVTTYILLASWQIPVNFLISSPGESQVRSFLLIVIDTELCATLRSHGILPVLIINAPRSQGYLLALLTTSISTAYN